MSARTMTGLLADLESRAGASDQDREAWLRDRNGGCTATQARDLQIGALRSDTLARQKLSGELEADLSYVPVIGWGKDREPVIAERLRGEGIEPETRVFHHAENSRYLASPDGVGVDFDGALIVSEIKTSNVPLEPGSAAYVAKGYEWQMQWVMFVTGAVRCRFVVEIRVDTEGGFKPGAEYRYWVERDEAKIAELVTVVDAFLAEMDQLAAEGPAPIDEAVDTHAVNYLRGLAAEKEGKALKEASYKALLEAGVSQESPLARVTFSPGKPATEFTEEVIDLEAAAAALPKETAQLERAKARVLKLQAEWDALASEHKKTVTSTTSATRPRVTVTAGKEMKK